MSSKQEILKILEKNRGVVISGEALAASLQISRAAVWKSIHSLREEGYRITAVTNQGYCLLAENDRLSAEGISAFLENERDAEKIRVYPVLASTNQTAKKLAMEGAAHGTVVLADMQTAGRGRMGRSFYSPTGNGIYMSILLRPTQLTTENSILVTTAASVAVCRAIFEVSGQETQIKWVNDIYQENRKICGILTEAITDFETGGIECLILGIGVNLRGKREELPSELQDIVGFVFDEEEAPVTRNRMVAEVIKEIGCLEEWIKNKSYLEEYRRRSNVLGKEIQVIQQGTCIPAKAIDIDDNGGLVIQLQDKRVKTLCSGEISIRRNL